MATKTKKKKSNAGRKPLPANLKRYAQNVGFTIGERTQIDAKRKALKLDRAEFVRRAVFKGANIKETPRPLPRTGHLQPDKAGYHRPLTKKAPKAKTRKPAPKAKRKGKR